MIYFQLFLAFLILGIVGYGGGPASIPLIEYEVVNRYGWMTTSQFSEVLALGNSLPGPIATKMAGYIGFEVGGVLGSIVALFAIVAPSLVLMVVLLSILYRYKNSPKVKRLSKVVLPAVAILMGSLTVDFFYESFQLNGLWETVFIAIITLFFLEKWKVHPAFVIIGGLVFGAIFLT